MSEENEIRSREDSQAIPIRILRDLSRYLWELRDRGISLYMLEIDLDRWSRWRYTRKGGPRSLSEELRAELVRAWIEASGSESSDAFLRRIREDPRFRAVAHIDARTLRRWRAELEEKGIPL